MKTMSVKIPSISCGHCVNTIRREMGELRGVKTIEVNLETKTATIGYDEPAAEADIEAKLVDIGYPPVRQV